MKRLLKDLALGYLVERREMMEGNSGKIEQEVVRDQRDREQEAFTSTLQCRGTASSIHTQAHDKSHNMS